MTYQTDREALITAQTTFNKSSQFELIRLIADMFNKSPGVDCVSWQQSFTDQSGSGRDLLCTTKPIFSGNKWSTSNPWVIFDNPSSEYAQEIAPKLQDVDFASAKLVAKFLADPIHADMLLKAFGDDNGIIITRNYMTTEPLRIRNVRIG